MRPVVNRIASLSALATILLAAGCGSNQGTGLLFLSISADPQLADEVASKLVVSYPGGAGHVYQGTFPPKDRNMLPLKLQVPNLPASDTPVTFTVQGFASSGCAVTKLATTGGVVIKAGTETQLISVTLLKSDTSCGDAGIPMPPADDAGSDVPLGGDGMPGTGGLSDAGSGGTGGAGSGGVLGSGGARDSGATTKPGTGGVTAAGGNLGSAGGSTTIGIGGISAAGGTTSLPGTGGVTTVGGAGTGGAAAGGSTGTGGTATGGTGTGGAIPMSRLTLTTTGIAAATGKATPSPAGTSCGTGCYSYPQGQQVQIVAAGDAPSLFVAWSGDCAGQGGTCSLSMSADKTSVAHFRPNMNIMFVTDGTLKPSTIGSDLASADAFCAQSAAAAFLGGSVWKAWLATTKVNAGTHIGQSASGWIRVDGLPFATSMTNLLAGKILYPPRVTELNRTGLFAVATGADENGDAIPAFTCGDWTSSGSFIYGDAASTRFGWTNFAGAPDGCETALASIYCFESDSGMAAVPTPVVPANARRAFLSHTTWIPGAGASAADLVCQSDAATAGIANASNYRALLTTNVAATDPTRISLSGPPWFRLDGTQLVATAADLAAPAADKMLTALNVDSTGSYLSNYPAWTGSSTAPSAYTNVVNCNNWTSGSAGVSGYWGAKNSSSFAWWAGNTQACSQPAALYCFER